MHHSCKLHAYGILITLRVRENFFQSSFESLLSGEAICHKTIRKYQWLNSAEVSFHYPSLGNYKGVGKVCQCVLLYTVVQGSRLLPSVGSDSSKTLDQDFSVLAVLTFWARSLFVVGSCPMHCRICSSIPGLCPLDTSSTLHPIVTNKNDVSRYCQMPPRGAIVLPPHTEKQ